MCSLCPRYGINGGSREQYTVNLTVDDGREELFVTMCAADFAGSYTGDNLHPCLHPQPSPAAQNPPPG